MPTDVDTEQFWRFLGYAELSELEQLDAELEYEQNRLCPSAAILAGMEWQRAWMIGYLQQIDDEIRMLTNGARGF